VRIAINEAPAQQEGFELLELAVDVTNNPNVTVAHALHRTSMKDAGEVVGRIGCETF
jgi:hypothetical protein